MQLLNNIRASFAESTPQRKLLVIGMVGGTAVLILVLILAFGSTGSKHIKNEYVDPGTGETVSDPAGKVAETEGATTQQKPIVFLGFSKLTDRGLSKVQHDKIKEVLQTYSDTSNAEITELSLATSSITITPPQIGSPNNETVVTGTLTANRKTTYALELHYDSITTIQVILKKDGAVVYDSTPLDLLQNNTPVGD